MTEKKPRPDRSALLRESREEGAAAERYAAAAQSAVEPMTAPTRIPATPAVQVS